MKKLNEKSNRLKYRLHGKAPFSIAVVHGGPGAGGEMAPVAGKLAGHYGVLEPIQTARSLEGQIQELRTILQRYGSAAVVLIGYSWGAWLSFIVAARYPALVKKLVLVASAPFEHKYVAALQETRLSRLQEYERKEFLSLTHALADPSIQDKDDLLKQLAILTIKTDNYKPIVNVQNFMITDYSGKIYSKVWQAASELRRSGQLLAFGKQILCPVIALHGDYDPHPAAGVQVPLSNVLNDFHFILIKKCGHKPWQEKQARGKFFRILEKEIE